MLGPAKAAAIWMAKWDEKKDRVPAVSDVIMMRKYLRHKYVERRWMSDAHRHLYEPAPAARFLEAPPPPPASSSTSSTAMTLAKDSGSSASCQTTTGSRRSDVSLGQSTVSSRSSHSGSSDTHAKAVAIRQLPAPNSNTHRKPGIIQVNSPNSVTIFDRYHHTPNGADNGHHKHHLQRERSHSDASSSARQSGHSAASQADDDDVGAGLRHDHAHRSSELTVVTRHYLRDTKPPSSMMTASPTSDHDHASRRGGGGGGGSGYHIGYDDEPIDEFFEIMRERVSGPRGPPSETSSTRSGGNGGGSLNNPFSKLQQAKLGGGTASLGLDADRAAHRPDQSQRHNAHDRGIPPAGRCSPGEWRPDDARDRGCFVAQPAASYAWQQQQQSIHDGLTERHGRNHNDVQQSRPFLSRQSE
ncbi:hypothetical protein SYNPS1DRAFT_28484 [Syncephalis pseudoplumigaleata]|uniref:Uncharacterized protein n=1 Tax=Syncephalis pseudoplumigaleata TaxID=1712513 RepID=A0A4P9Z016_9FUNG|nr:hypothetical protein SYNPS1DRAFT_28484 [Syncephalis pseudoplumigaleata]|eukprot:RKP25793.1 hypothetical protein SYNPS1DRAFT_28484 [Syncephalis pseudoplumigaleata]